MNSRTTSTVTIPGDVWCAEANEVLRTLQADKEEGLSDREVGKRRNEFGTNRLREHKKRGVWQILWEQFKSIIILLLGVAALVAFWFGEVLEAWAITVVILINSLIGFFTELRAVRSMEALYRLGTVKTRVRRNGTILDVDATELVPGDIVVVEGGDIITADLRIVESSKLQADESALTGESVPVAKQRETVPQDTVLAERSCMLYKGTAVTRGSGVGVVVAIGGETELGHISLLVEDAEEEQTPLEERLDKLGYRLIGVTLLIAFFVAVSGIVVGKELFLMIETGIALAVATIPEGLPIVATIALAKGLRIMAEKNALVNRLSSVETLGATDLICTDKTGTLTENRMTVNRILLPARDIELENGTEPVFKSNGSSVDPSEDPDLKRALQTGALCNNAGLSTDGPQGSGTGDPLEVALLAAARSAGLEAGELAERYPEVREEAFDPDLKMMATWNRLQEGWYRVHVKGAPGAVLEACETMLVQGVREPLPTEKMEEWIAANESLAGQGLRMLALASKDTDTDRGEPYENLSFIGLVALLDPPRSDIRSSIEICRRAGIRVVMITGDQAETARFIAEKVGLRDGEKAELVKGSDLPTNEELEASLPDTHNILEATIFARINPRQKLDLIEFYQNNGHIVAMTGDGVNDAPALKKADIGIAMGQRGTQVAREAADMVLTDDAFSTIVTAIEQGRVIFGNIRRFIYYLMSCNVSEVLIVGGASLIGIPLPILPLQILFLNLVTDVFPALAIGMNREAADVMQRPPRPADTRIIVRRGWRAMGIYAAGLTMGT
ncbi:MAG: HAD-IC family P-type ATPase, partial [Balneolaceae bacterium]|nr:HAD-IC family P-type ATPase [Balneolaceae bacterium]